VLGEGLRVNRSRMFPPEVQAAAANYAYGVPVTPS
jgi:hypothetical protein